MARQRWRLVLARSADAPESAGRDLSASWEDALERTGLPFHRPPGKARRRIAFGAPLPLGIAAERELADLVFDTVVPIWRVREALIDCLPDGWRLVDLYDVWLGNPALAGQVVAADYRITLAGAAPALIAAAAAGMIAADRLPRQRVRGSGPVPYDLRPLVDSVAVDGDGPAVVIRVRTRFDPAVGTGRPEEVVAELGERVGSPLEVVSTVRERLVLATDG